MNLAEFLTEQASADRLAVSDAAGDHTYATLTGAAAELADRLTEAGVSAGARVALVAPNGLFWVASYLAILARGMIVVPIPPTLPPAEMTDRIAWLGCRAVLAGRREARRLVPSSGQDVVLVEEAAELSPGSEPKTLQVVDVPSDSDAVYAFTSGTTGDPRVVRHTHRNLMVNTNSILSYLDITTDDRVLVVLPFSYVFGASLLHTHLRVGAALVIQGNLVYPEAVVERLIANRCTGFAGVPSTFHLLLRGSSFGNRPLPSLRTIQQAGGRLSPVLVDELIAAQPQARIFIMYGQTEATARLSALAPDEIGRRPGSIGRGIPGVELSVVDGSGAPVEPGVVGEIWARGASISPGYLDDLEATARRMPNGVLRTGDQATVDEDGYIYIVDRVEDFIKSWGFRIASQDIESVVMRMPDLMAVAAVGVPDEAAGERIELAVVRRPGSTLDQAAVLRHCRDHLAKYMLPAAVHLLERLPLNVNGKVSKRELRSLFLGPGDSSAPGG